jgi:hypothetical protein
MSAKGYILPNALLYRSHRQVLTVENVSDFHVDREGEAGYPAALINTTTGHEKWVPLKELEQYEVRSDDPAFRPNKEQPTESVVPGWDGNGSQPTAGEPSGGAYSGWPGDVAVRSYTRKDGTHVRAHTRRRR